MAKIHVISALVERRARLDGEIRAAHVRLMLLKAHLAHLDAVIRMFKPGADPEAIQPKVTLAKNPASVPKGTGSRRALELLRECGKPLTCQEIAQGILERLGKEPDARAVAMLAKTIHSSFSRRKDGAR
jgi:hypothetical protein